MARTKASRPRTSRAPVIPSNSLVASAVRYSGVAPRIHNQNNQAWQAECYRHYMICGEARFAARFFGHALSRATLFTGIRGGNGFTRSTGGTAFNLLDDLFNGRDGQAQMLEAIGIHLTIAGECYLVGRTAKDPETDEELGEVWEIISVLEIKISGKQWAIHYGDGIEDIILADDDVVIRIWNPSPSKRIEADSPFRSLLPILTEIEWLTRHIFAQTSSRLAGAGILFLPQGMSFPAPPEQEGRDVSALNEADQFMISLGDAMMRPLEDPSSPAAIVPIVVTAPGDEIQHARLMHFWSELDSNSLAMRSEAIRRFATGMDLPAEQIIGMSGVGGGEGGESNGVSHWGAWAVEEATIKMHIEPMLELVSNALTVGYLRPLAPTAAEVVTYETSKLRLRPDRSKEAFELFAVGAISLKRLLLENGFDPADEPDEIELKMFFLRKIATGSATPEQVEAALEQLGITLDSKRFGDLGQSETRETRPDPSLEDHPEKPRTPLDSTPEVPSAAALMAASEGLIYRALEKAGNRVLNARTRGKDRAGDIQPCEAHLSTLINGQGPALLEGAFTYAPLVLNGIAPHQKIVPLLEAYCLGLFDDQVPHSRERLAAHLTEALR